MIFNSGLVPTPISHLENIGFLGYADLPTHSFLQYKVSFMNIIIHLIRKVSGTGYACGAHGMVGIAIRKMGRSHIMKGYVLHTLNFILKPIWRQL